MPFMFWDPTMLLLIPAMILAFYAQTKVQSTYAKFSQILASSRRSGREVAETILGQNGITDVQIEPGQGRLSDHYDPIHKTVSLSPQNYSEPSLAAISVAAHEIGHVNQHAQGYAPLKFRTAIFPIANVGTMLAWPIPLIGLFCVPGVRIGGVSLIDAGIALFATGVLFQLVTITADFAACPTP